MLELNQLWKDIHLADSQQILDKVLNWKLAFFFHSHTYLYIYVTLHYYITLRYYVISNRGYHRTVYVVPTRSGTYRACCGETFEPSVIWKGNRLNQAQLPTHTHLHFSDVTLGKWKVFSWFSWKLFILFSYRLQPIFFSNIKKKVMALIFYVLWIENFIMLMMLMMH